MLLYEVGYMIKKTKPLIFQGRLDILLAKICKIGVGICTSIIYKKNVFKACCPSDFGGPDFFAH